MVIQISNRPSCNDGSKCFLRWSRKLGNISVVTHSWELPLKFRINWRWIRLVSGTMQFVVIDQGSSSISLFG